MRGKLLTPACGNASWTWRGPGEWAASQRRACRVRRSASIDIASKRPLDEGLRSATSESWRPTRRFGYRRLRSDVGTPRHQAQSQEALPRIYSEVRAAWCASAVAANGRVEYTARRPRVPPDRNSTLVARLGGGPAGERTRASASSRSSIRSSTTASPVVEPRFTGPRRRELDRSPNCLRRSADESAVADGNPGCARAPSSLA